MKLLLLITLLSLSFTPSLQKCVSVGISETPNPATVGQTIQVTGHFTNCSNSGMNSVNVQMMVVNPCLPGGPTNGPGSEDLLYTYIDIPAHQTIDITASYTIPCNDSTGQWQAKASIRPRGNTNNIISTTNFTVTP